MATTSGGSGGSTNPPGNGQEYTDPTTLQKIREHIFRGVVKLKRYGGAASRIALEPDDDATYISLRAPSTLANGTYHISAPDDIPAGAGYFLTATPTGREVTLGYSSGGGGSSTLDGLTDTVITAVSSGELLVWDGTADWINRTLAEAGISAIGHNHAASDITSGTLTDARISESNVTQHETALSVLYSQLSGGSEISGTTFPTTNLYTGRQYYHETYNEMFTYHDGTGLPSGTAVWLGELQNLHFGTTNATSTSGTQAFFNNGSVLGVKNSRGSSFGFDIMTMGLDVQNGNSTNLSGTFTVWAGTTSLISQTWSSVTRMTVTAFARATSGSILMADFAITGGTIKRPVGVLRFRHVITA